MSQLVRIPLAYGLVERVDPKLAPFGVLAECRNLRVRRDGRLGSRKAYNAVPASGGFTAYDVFQHNGRLCALASGTAETHPVDVYEVLAGGAAALRPSDSQGQHVLSPFSEPRDLGNVPEVNGNGIVFASSAVGSTGGSPWLGTLWRTFGNVVFTAIWRQDTGQLHSINSGSTSIRAAQLTYSVDAFYRVVALSSSSAVSVSRFRPGTDSSFASFHSAPAGVASADYVDIVPVQNATTARFAVLYIRDATVNVRIVDSAGALLGVAVSFALAAASACVDADQASNTINVTTTAAAGAITLRTFNFATGALTVGPTALTNGDRVVHCRVEPTVIATVTSDESTALTTIQIRSQAAHALLETWTVQDFILTTRPITALSGTRRGIALSGFVGPYLPTRVSPITGDNAMQQVLLYINASSAVMHYDERNSGTNPSPRRAHHNLQLDSSTGLLSWTRFVRGLVTDGIANYRNSLLRFFSSGRRQCAAYAGQTLMAGAPFQTYDGTQLTETGFAEQPGVSITSQQVGSGSLTLLGQYTYVVTWEYVRADGTVERSAVSEPADVTLTGANAEVTLAAKVPHSLRAGSADAGIAAGLSVIVYRTSWDSTTQTKSVALFRSSATAVPLGMATYGVPLSITDGTSDATLVTRGQLYTQAGSGALSGEQPNEAPPSGSLVSISASRALVGGLSRENELCESKEARIDEAISFSQLTGFMRKMPARPLAISSQDGVRIAWSSDAVHVVAGDGPNDLGANALPPAVKLGATGGIVDWRSLLVAQDYIYFQLDTDKLYAMPRGAGAPEWVGVDVQATLGAFPVVAGAAQCIEDDTVCFAASNSAGTDARILVRSQRTGIWSADTPPLGTTVGISAMCQDGRGIAYVSGGVIYRQQADYADNGFFVIPHAWRTQPVYPFGLGGYGTITALLVTGEYRSAGVLALRVSYDDGINFSTLDTFTLTGLTVGQTVARRWALPQCDTTSLVVELVYTPSAVGEGIVLNDITLEVQPEQGLKEVPIGDAA